MFKLDKKLIRSYSVAMKNSVIRARIDYQLKRDASRVLASCGLEPSDAIRLFLQQVVACNGIPFPIHAMSKVQRASSERMRAMKSDSQARDRAIAANQDLSGAEMLLIRPSQLIDAKVNWPSAKLSD